MGSFLEDLFGRFGGTQTIPATTQQMPGPWAEGLTREVTVPAQTVTTPGTGLLGATQRAFGGGGGGGVLGAEAPGGGAIDWTQIQGIDPVLGAGLNRMQAGLLGRERGTAQQLGLISKVPVLRDILGTMLDVYGTAQAARRGALGTQRALGQLGGAAQAQAFPQFALGAARLAGIPRAERQAQKTIELAEKETASQIENRNLRTYWQNEVDRAQMAVAEATTDAQRALATQRLTAAQENLAQADVAGQLPTLPPGFTPTPQNVRVIGGERFIVGPEGRTVPLGAQAGAGAKTPPMGAMSKEQAQDWQRQAGGKGFVYELQGFPGLYGVKQLPQERFSPERSRAAFAQLDMWAQPQGWLGGAQQFNDALLREQLRETLEVAYGYQIAPETVLDPQGRLDPAKIQRLRNAENAERWIPPLEE
jgi:hypothetical protein